MRNGHLEEILSMSGKIFVDTNILVYCFDNSDMIKKFIGE